MIYQSNKGLILWNLTNPTQLVKTFCVLDDLSFALFGKTNRGRPSMLSRSETATIILMKNAFGINCMKKLYRLLQTNYSHEFHLPVYKNFVVTMNWYSLDFLVLINVLLHLQHRQSGVVKIIDSTPLPVCKNIRIYARPCWCEILSTIVCFIVQRFLVKNYKSLFIWNSHCKYSFGEG